MLTGCAKTWTEPGRRWPHHRKQGDARFDALERRAVELEGRVTSLARELAELQRRLPLPTPQPPAASATDDVAP